MNTQDSKSSDNDDRSWLDRLTQMVTGTPYTRADLEGLLQLAADMKSSMPMQKRSWKAP